MASDRRLSVFLDGTFVGELVQSLQGSVAFTYDDDYRRQPTATPLSLSMPVVRATHPAGVVRPFLQGLLPDSPTRLDQLAREFHTSASNPFALLGHIGRDAAGAVQIMPAGEDAPDAAGRQGTATVLSPDEFDAVIADLVTHSATWGLRDSASRWSLAGAQPKAALFRTVDGQWAVPEGSTPTTHILKPAVTPFVDHDVNEFVTLQAARLLGLQVASSELITTGAGDRVFVSVRYDRELVDGRWHRLHQEDFCQALSVDPARKCQSDGGPGFLQLAGLIATFPDLRDRRASQRALFDAMVFNVSAANTDAHAKNYSVLLTAERARLAPLYDLASHALYPSPSLLASAMKVGADYRLDTIGINDFVTVGQRLQISADEAAARAHQLRAQLAAAFDQAATTVIGNAERTIAHRLAVAIATRADERGWGHDELTAFQPMTEGTPS